jgi:polyhydroxybutyrate depolymerase
VTDRARLPRCSASRLKLQEARVMSGKFENALWLFIPLALVMLVMAGAVLAAPVDTRSIDVGGVSRSFTVFKPSAIAHASGPLPAVIALHGGKGSPEQLERSLGLDEAAERGGFLAVYPEGIDHAWNDSRAAQLRGNRRAHPGDDVAFLDALVAKLVADGIANPKRIYLMGVSNGGFMTMTMACRGNSPFAAYAAIIASAPAEAAESCAWQSPLPILMINGTDDRLVRYDGKEGWFQLSGNLPPFELAQVLARHNGCGQSETRGLPDRDPSDGSTVSKTVWTACAPGSAVEFYKVEGGGHQPPVISDKRRGWLIGKFLGNRNHDIDSAEEIWAFFKRFAR